MFFAVADMPPQIQERIICSVHAAYKYQIPANIVLAIAEKEGGKPGKWVKNKNGTHDVGSMQTNTGYLKDLAQYGITANDVAQPGCYPYDLAAWRIRIHLVKDSGDIWTRAANYHSRTPKYNSIYREDLIWKAEKWRNWLLSYSLPGTNPEPPQIQVEKKINTASRRAVKFSNPLFIVESDRMPN